MPRDQRALPPEPHLDHLKKQAKDLLEAHKRGDAEAAARIREALPAFASKTDADVLRAPFALHDAQSAIAREYGYKSWSDLRAEVARMRESAFPSAMFKAMEPQLQAMWGRPIPAKVTEEMRKAWAKETSDVLKAPLPERIPLLAIRNAMLVPGALAPFHLARPASTAAIDLASAATPRVIAAFAQRDAASEDVTADSLHPIGCEALVHAHILPRDGKAFVVLRGLRWIALEGVEAAGGESAALLAKVAPVEVDDSAEADDVAALFATLRTVAKSIASAMPGGAEVVGIIEGMQDPERLANLLVANVGCPVEETARYAAERTVSRKLRVALGLVEAAAKSRTGP